MYNISIMFGILVSYIIYTKRIKDSTQQGLLSLLFSLLLVSLVFTAYGTEKIIGYKSMILEVYTLFVFSYLTKVFAKIPFTTFLNYISIPVLLTLIFGKIGCLFEGCCGTANSKYGLQLFELFSYISIVIYGFLKSSKLSGVYILLFMLLVRWISDYFRVDNEFFFYNVFTVRQLQIFPLLMFIFIYLKFNRNR